MKYISLFLICTFSLVACDRQHSLNGKEYHDGFTFISSSALGTSYSYKFENKNYSLFAKTNELTGSEIKSFLIESGRYKLKENQITLYPSKKICISLGKTQDKEMLVPYAKYYSLDDNLRFVSRDTLSKKQMKELDFSSKVLFLENDKHSLRMPKDIGNEIFKSVRN